MPEWVLLGWLLVGMAGCSDAGPTRLAGATQGAFAIAADADHVYWADVVGNLRRVPKGGGSATIVTSGPRQAPGLAPWVTSMVVDAMTVYWTDGHYCSAVSCASGDVYSAPKAGGVSTALASGVIAPTSLTAGDTNLYFLQSAPDASGYLVTQLSRAAGVLAVLGSKRNIISNLALDADGLYWAVADASGVGASIVKRSLTDGSETTLASGWTAWPSAAYALAQTNSQLLTLNDSNVFWIAGDASQNHYTMLTVSKHGGVATPLVTRLQSSPFPPAMVAYEFRPAMVADSAYLYFSDTDAFWKVPVGGGKCTPFALSRVTWAGFVQDEGNIYWFGTDTGYIESTPKSP